MRKLIFLLGLVVAAIASGQDQPTKTLEQIAARLRSAGVELVYSSDRIDPAMPVSVQAETRQQIATLRETLSIRGLSLSEVRADFFVITAGWVNNEQAAVILTGKVRDASTGRVLPGARILLDGGESVLSDRHGVFLVTGLLAGQQKVRISANGYLAAAPETLDLQAATPHFLEISLEPLPVDLQRMMVSASHYNLAWSDSIQSSYLSASDLITQPSLGDDPMRAVNRLPGISASGLSAQTRIRGGAADETLLVLDNQVLVDPFHLKGFQSMFSALNAATLESIDFYAGGFPIEYGNRLSGVVHLRSRQVDSARLYEVGLGLFDSYLLAAGHDQSEDNNWLLSVRRGGLDLALGLLENDFGSPRYADAYIRFEHRFNDHSRLRLSGLLTRDELSLNTSDQSEQAQADSRDSHFWLSYLRDFANGGHLDITLSGLNFSGTRTGQVLIPQAVSGVLLDHRDSEGVGIRATYEQLLHPRWHLRIGAEARHLDASYIYTASSQAIGPLGRIEGTLGPANGSLGLAQEGLQLGLWTGLRWQTTDQVVVEAGVRWDDFDYLDVAEEEKFSTRLNVFYRPWSGTTLRGAWGQFRQAQGIEELHVEYGEDSFKPPQLAEHSVLSWDQELPMGLALRVEAYQKRITNPWRRVELLYDPLVLLPDLAFDRVEFDPSSSKARGLEITLRGAGETLDWWVAFTRASVNDRIEGSSVPRSWDQAYAATGGLEWSPGVWTWSLAANYHDGWPAASLTQAANGALISSARNSQRFGDFLTLDLRASRRYTLSRGHLRVYFELGNALNRSNPCCSEYRLDDLGLLEVKAEQWLPLIPSFGLVWSNQ